VPAVVPVFVSAMGSVVVVVLALRSRDLLAFPGLDRDREVPVAAPATGIPIIHKLPALFKQGSMIRAHRIAGARSCSQSYQRCPHEKS